MARLCFVLFFFVIIGQPTSLLLRAKTCDPSLLWIIILFTLANILYQFSR